MEITRDSLFLMFQGRLTKDLEEQLEIYNKELANMVCIDNMDAVLLGKEVIEEILEERKNGANPRAD